jgi:hypothetical protein
MSYSRLVGFGRCLNVGCLPSEQLARLWVFDLYVVGLSGDMSKCEQSDGES